MTKPDEEIEELKKRLDYAMRDHNAYVTTVVELLGHEMGVKIANIAKTKMELADEV